MFQLIHRAVSGVDGEGCSHSRAGTGRQFFGNIAEKQHRGFRHTQLARDDAMAGGLAFSAGSGVEIGGYPVCQVPVGGNGCLGI